LLQSDTYTHIYERLHEYLTL